MANCENQQWKRERKPELPSSKVFVRNSLKSSLGRARGGFLWFRLRLELYFSPFLGQYFSANCISHIPRTVFLRSKLAGFHSLGPAALEASPGFPTGPKLELEQPTHFTVSPGQISQQTDRQTKVKHQLSGLQSVILTRIEGLTHDQKWKQLIFVTFSR